MKLVATFLTAILIALAYFFYPTQTIVSHQFDDIERFVPALMQEAAIPGLAMAKIEQGEVAYIGTFGFANLETRLPVTETTLFNIASISKPVMGLALLQLVDQQKLTLDRDINDYLSFTIDNPHVENEVITLRHLASHASGIDDYYDIQSYSANQDSPVSLKDHLYSLLAKNGDNYQNGRYFLNQMPGQSRQYSNLSAGLAGQLVEDVTGMTLAEYSKTKLFPRLGMPATRWLLGDLDMADIAVPYEVEQCIPWTFICANTEDKEINYVINHYVSPSFEYKSFVPYPHFGNPQYPDGGLRTSIVELSRFLTHLLSNTDINGDALLTEESYQEMFYLQLDPAVSDSQRFFWRDRAGLTGHMGSDLGVFTALYFDRESKNGFIILMNRGWDDNSAQAMKRLADKLMKTRFSNTPADN